MSGLRKTNKITSLSNLNDKYKLGLTIQQINDMTISQLAKKIKAVKKAHGIPDRKTHEQRNLLE